MGSQKNDILFFCKCNKFSLQSETGRCFFLLISQGKNGVPSLGNRSVVYSVNSVGRPSILATVQFTLCNKQKGKSC